MSYIIIHDFIGLDLLGTECEGSVTRSIVSIQTICTNIAKTKK